MKSIPTVGLLLAIPVFLAVQSLCWARRSPIDYAGDAIQAVKSHLESNSQHLSGVTLTVSQGPVHLPDHWRWHDNEQYGPSRIGVRLMDTSEEPVAGCPARMIAGSFEQVGISDEQGWVEFSGAPAGKASIEVYCRGWNIVEYRLRLRPSEKRSFTLVLYRGATDRGQIEDAPELSDYQALPGTIVLVRAHNSPGIRFYLVLFLRERTAVLDGEPYYGVTAPLSEQEWRAVTDELEPFYDAILEVEPDAEAFAPFLSSALLRNWSAMTGLSPDLIQRQSSRYLRWSVVDLLRRAEDIKERRMEGLPNLTPQEQEERVQEFFVQERDRIQGVLMEKGARHEEHLASLESYARLLFGEGMIRKVLIDGPESRRDTPLGWIQGREVYQTRLSHLGLYFAREAGRVKLVALVIHD